VGTLPEARPRALQIRDPPARRSLAGAWVEVLYLKSQVFRLGWPISGKQNLDAHASRIVIAANNAAHIAHTSKKVTFGPLGRARGLV
jgi:hypothetical protein